MCRSGGTFRFLTLLLAFDQSRMLLAFTRKKKKIKSIELPLMAVSGSFVPFIPAGRVNARIFLPPGCAWHHGHPRSFPAKLRTQRKIGAALGGFADPPCENSPRSLLCPKTAFGGCFHSVFLSSNSQLCFALLCFEVFFLRFSVCSSWMSLWINLASGPFAT